MHDVELVLVSLLVAVAGLAAVARAWGVPYPIVLVVGGLVLGFLPGIPEAQLAPDLVLVLFLPPLLYSAAFFANLHELRRNVRPISLMAIGLVLATMCAVAIVAHELIAGLSWAGAFTLGAIVAPTDPIAAATIARRQNAPRRIVSVLEGESLINDGTALVAYEYRQRRLDSRAGQPADGENYEHRALKYQKMVRSVLDAQRGELVRLRDNGTISYEVMHRLERELDLEDERLEI